MSACHGSGGSGVPLPLAEVSIQDVIAARKAERKLKAEGKRQTDLQRIKDMRSTIGIDPLQRFPKEIWLQILDELDPEDRGNVWHVHPLFRDLMEGTRVLDLFLQVLQLDTFQSEIYHSFGSSLNEQLRCISKAARNSFDKRTEDNLMKQIQVQQADSFYSVDDVYLGNTNEPRLLNRLLASFVVDEESSPAKRLFSRALSVTFTEYELDENRGNIMELFEQFKTNVTDLLKVIGSQLWHFRFFVNLDRIAFPFTNVYILFQSWACQMPNLKWLEISIDQPSSQMIDETSGGMMSAAQSAIRKYPFPTLWHLERLTFHSSYIPGKMGMTFLNIYGIVLGANQHIKMLDLADEGNESSRENLLFLASLTQALQLTRFTVCDEDYGMRYNASHLQRISPIVNYNWPLKIISLSLEPSNVGESIMDLLGFLQKFPTLETVKLIHLESFSIGHTDRLGYLKLPNLTEFELELNDPEIEFDNNSNIHFFFSLQFLLECKKLKNICWKLTGFEYLKLREHLKNCERENHGKLVNFRAGLRYLYDSNIWKVFPALETLNVRVRKEYSKYGGDNIKCEHGYLRKDIQGMSVRRFLNEHECCSRDDLSSCVVLFK